MQTMSGVKTGQAPDGGYWLDKAGSEFGQIAEYVRTCALNTGEATKLEIWKIENLELSFRFTRKSSNMLRVVSLIDSAQLDDKNNLQSVCRNGFVFDRDKRGMMVTTGNIEFGVNAFNKDYCFIYTEIAIGRSFVLDIDERNTELPSEYDSFYVPSQPLDRNKDGKFSLQEYQLSAMFDNRDPKDYYHRYFLNDSTLLCPKYVVKFRLVKLNESDLINQTFSFDQLRNTLEVEFDREDAFDSSFLNDNPERRNIATLDRAFSQAMEDINHRDAIVESKREWIVKQLNTVDEKVRAINFNYAEITESIEDTCKLARSKLESLTRSKLQVLLSMEIELRREMEQLDWLDRSIHRQLGVLATNSHKTANDAKKRKSHFIRQWKSHTMIRNSVCRNKPSELVALATIHGDIRLRNNLEIYTDPFFLDQRRHRQQRHHADQSSEVYSDEVLKTRLDLTNKEAKKSAIFSVDTVVGSDLQGLVDSEQENIHNAIASTVTSGLYQLLPKSVIRPGLSGERYNTPLHDILDGLDEDDSRPGRVLNGNNGAPQPNVVRAATTRLTDTDDARVRQLFEDTLLQAVKQNWSMPPLPVDEDIAGHFQGNGVGQASPSSIESIIKAKAHQSSYEYSPGTVHSAKSNACNPPEYSNLVFNSKTSPNRELHSKVAHLRRPTYGSAQSHSVAPGVDRSVAADEDVDLTVSMDLRELTRIISKRSVNLSLQDIAYKKMKQLQAKQVAEFQESISSLSKSNILQPIEAETIYFNLPFFSKPPSCKLIYSTFLHSRSLGELYSRSMKQRGPSVLILRTTGGAVIGSYLSQAIIPVNAWAGSPSCFLFSCSLNLKVPYHARTAASLDECQGPFAFFAQSDYLFIGDGDLTIDEELKYGSSELENCYGLGLERSSREALCVMAGRPLFGIEHLELWSIYNFT